MVIRRTQLALAIAILAGVGHAQTAYLNTQSAFPGETVTLYATSTSALGVIVKRSYSFSENKEVLRAALPAQSQTSPNRLTGSYAWAPTSPQLDIQDAITLEAWVRPTMGSDFQGIVTKYGVPGDASYMIYLLPTNQVSFYLGETGTFNVENRLATSPIPLNNWTHIVATWDGQTKKVYLNGKLDVSRAWTGPIYRNSEPVRVASYGVGQGQPGEYFTGHVDSPAIYNRALTRAEIEQRYAEKADYTAANPGVLNGCVAQWNFGEEEGRVLRDVSGNGHDLTLVNNATRGVSGPSPRLTKNGSHSIRFAADDLFELNWEPSWSFTVPQTWDAGFYFVELMGTRLPFVVKPRPADRAKTAVLVATATWVAYNSWSGNSLYNSHEDGTIAYYVGLQQPNPGSAPGSTTGSIQHLTDAERYLYWWLWREGYEFDLYTDFDLHRDPTLLDGYDVLMLNGHSEYWSHEMIDHVEAFQDAGGSLVNLSGNTMWSLVSFNPDFTVMEGRKHPHGSGTIPASERWHSTAGAPLGGTMRCIGRPEHEVIGTGYGIGGGGARGWGVVTDPTHWVYAGTGVKKGDEFGKNGLNGGIMMGYEVDVIDPQWTPSNVEVIGIGRYPTPTFQLGITNCQSRTSWSTLEGGEIIYYDHPGGGGVFGIASVTVSGTLLTDAVASKMVSNVLDRFLDKGACAPRNGSGVNVLGYECATAPVLGTTWSSTVVTTPQTISTLIALAATPAQTPLLGGEILIGLAPPPLVQSSNGSHAVPIPNLPSLAGARLYAQGFRVEQPGGIVMMNAQDLTLGP